MSDERYADGVGEIAVMGSTIRLDLVSYSAVDKDSQGNPKPVFRQRVVMPVEGFVRSFGVMAQAMQQLEKQGVVKRAHVQGTPASDVLPPKSSNFA